MKDVITLDSIKKIYERILEFTNQHVVDLVNKLKTHTNKEFFELNFVQLLTKFFVNLLTLLATVYELICYALSLKFKASTIIR